MREYRAQILKELLLDIGFIDALHMSSQDEICLDYQDAIKVYISREGYVGIYKRDEYSGVMSLFNDDAIYLIFNVIKEKLSKAEI